MSRSRKKPAAKSPQSSQLRAVTRPSLPGLPDEILNSILSQLDFPSLRVLAKTNKRFNRVATRPLCRSVDLTSRLDLNLPARKRQDRIKRISTGFARGLHRDPGRIAHVHSLTVPISPGVNSALLSVLRAVRPTLKSLTLRRGPAVRHGARSTAADTILGRLLELSTFGKLFPNLAQLSIEQALRNDLQQLAFCLQRMPSLEKISVSVSEPPGNVDDIKPLCCWGPAWRIHPSLHSMAISHSPGKSASSGPPEWVIHLFYLPVRLEQLDLFRHHHSGYKFGTGWSQRFIAATLPENGRRREGLRELRWRLPGTDILNLFQNPQDLPLLGVFGATDRGLQAGRMQIEAVHIPAHASLETLFVGVYLRSEMADADNSIIRDGPHVRRLPDHVVNKLQAAPTLSSIQFAHPSHDWDVQSPSHWDNSGRMGISIATVHHGDEALYVARSRTRSLATNRLKSISSGQEMFAMQADNDNTYFVATEDPVWQYATNYLGRRVPYNVLAEMAAVEGVDEWVGRDVQVSDRAWDVLVRWCNDRALAEEGH